MSAVAKELPTIIPAQGNALTPMEMLDRAVSQGASIETLDRLMTLQERWEKNQARKDFDAAISEAKKEIKPVARNRNGHNTRYADFAAVATAVDGPLSAHGLSYRFRTRQEGDRIHVTCVLSHRAGHSEENTIAGPADTSGSKNAIQAIGSTLTYLQRYSLMQAVGLAATNDDDGKAANAAKPITEKQAEEIKELIAHVGADIGKFLVAFQIETVDDLPSGRFDEAKARLSNYGKQRR